MKVPSAAGPEGYEDRVTGIKDRAKRYLMDPSRPGQGPVDRPMRPDEMGPSGWPVGQARPSETDLLLALGTMHNLGRFAMNTEGFRPSTNIEDNRPTFEMTNKPIRTKRSKESEEPEAGGGP